MIKNLKKNNLIKEKCLLIKLMILFKKTMFFSMKMDSNAAMTIDKVCLNLNVLLSITYLAIKMKIKMKILAIYHSEREVSH